MGRNCHYRLARICLLTALLVCVLRFSLGWLQWKLAANPSMNSSSWNWTRCVPIRLPQCDASQHRLRGHAGVRGSCRADVIRLLIEDVYDALRETGAAPALLYGSLLGAYRNKTIIPYTPDGDLGVFLMVSIGGKCSVLLHRLNDRLLSKRIDLRPSQLQDELCFTAC